MKSEKKRVNEATIIAGTALVAFTFLFMMTATEGKYWGKNEMDHYIIRITEGKDKAYLNSNTPTAMVINKVSGSSSFLRRDCVARGTCYDPDVCTVVDEGYVINKGRKVAKASLVVCDEQESKADRETENDAQVYEQMKGINY
ncbi:MAG: hypothetical protein AABX82_02570 [Nanoarchaeota archaeon]